MVDGSSTIEEEEEEVEDDSEGEEDRAKEDVASTPLMTVWGEWIYDILCQWYLCEQRFLFLRGRARGHLR